MKNFNWKEFREGREIAVHCNTEEKAKNFFEECMNNSIVAWCGGESPIQNEDTEWRNYRAETCYSNTDNIEYENLGWYQGHNYKIVEWIIEDNDIKIEATIEKQEQTEFTYQEVIAKIKDGETYSCSGINPYYVESISREGDDVLFQGEISDGVGINLVEQLFTLQEPKDKYRIYYVEHTVDGDTYRFREENSEDYFAKGESVICNTEKMGRTYGKVKETKSEKLTKKEYEDLDTIEEIETEEDN